MKQDLIIFGAGKIAEVVTWFFERDSNFNVVAFSCDDAYCLKDTYLGKPLVPISRLMDEFPPDQNHSFVAVGYQRMNQFRKEKFDQLKGLGYSFASYKSPVISGNFTVGENSIVMDHAMVQPFVRIGSNSFIWGGSMVGHHVTIEDNCWLTGGCMIGGSARIGNGSFIGLGSIVGHEVIIGDNCMLGAGTVTVRNLENNTVLIVPSTEPHRLNSMQFTRMSSCFKI